MKAKFFNPIMQNKLHIRCLKEILKDGCPEVHSIIVFSDRCTLKDVKTHSGYKDISVIYRNQVSAVVDMINHATPEMTPDALCDEIYTLLYGYSQVGDDVRIAHIRAINEQLNKSDTDDVISVSEPKQEMSVPKPVSKYISAMTKSERSAETPLSKVIKKCPRCGSPLALRTAKRGANVGKQFYGCINYPKCKYTEELK
ncbi:MAG: topoisomerase DNA-binding C4 zinc finger domain-containing protein [Ruminococcus sp.]|nr:topoisomerase DNA-binding C4 zinc finger domain-containing protein [Ruminococcus sp.]